jgi:cyclopropane-fatty-acyl-phospholipid synthase
MNTSVELAQPIEWPRVAAPAAAPVRTAVVARLLGPLAARTGIRIELPDGRSYGGTGNPVVVVADASAFLRRIATGGDVGFGESYMAGEWDSPELVTLLTALASRAETLLPAPVRAARSWYERVRPRAEENDREGVRRNIGAHYDLSNDLFAAFLDETMTYSSALFDHAGESLEAAQIRKIDRLLDATGVVPGSRLLEIGTGWGELALRAARRGAVVTSITASAEQAALARERVRSAGLSEWVDVRLEDYRDVTGTYDIIVSVEMIEAVGERWWPTYFGAIEEHLAPGGRVGLQSILKGHDRLRATRSAQTWINTYIFPGGLIPSETAICDAVAAHTSLRLVDRLYFGDSYATTLQRWRERFNANADVVAQLGFDRTFQRMWNYYLAYSEAGFRARYIDVAQIVLGKE